MSETRNVTSKSKLEFWKNTHIDFPVSLPFKKWGKKSRNYVTCFSKLMWHTHTAAKVDTVKGNEGFQKK